MPSSELESLSLMLGKQYHLLELLGKQPGRRTLLALDSTTNRKVVIKLLTFGEDFTWDALKLFEREAETLRSLDHPAIPQYLDSFEVEAEHLKGFALVQTYINARSLSEQLEAGRRFSETDMVAIAQQLLEILQYLHSRRPPVVHRDIKPSNILLGDRSAHSVGQVYLVDFGSVQTLMAREGGTMTIVGTYGYMPPEQFGGRTVPASDLYALGATLIYLGSGYHPADLPQQNFCIQFESVLTVGDGLKDWIGQLIEASLEQRFASVEEAQEKLRNITIESPKNEEKKIVEQSLPNRSLETLLQNEESSFIALKHHTYITSPSFLHGKIRGFSFIRSLYFWVPYHLIAMEEDLQAKTQYRQKLNSAHRPIKLTSILLPFLLFLSIISLFATIYAEDSYAFLFFLCICLMSLASFLMLVNSNENVKISVNAKSIKLTQRGYKPKAYLYDRICVGKNKADQLLISIFCQEVAVQKLLIDCNRYQSQWLEQALLPFIEP